jgi:hypothetical protein
LSQNKDETNPPDEAASPPPIKDEAHVLSLQNKIYHLSLSLDEANAKVVEAHEKSNEDQVRTAEELNAVLRDRELRIVEMEREMEKYKEMEGEMWKYKALGSVMHELKEKQTVTGAQDEGIEDILSRKARDDTDSEGADDEVRDARARLVIDVRRRGSKEEDERRRLEAERGKRGSDARRDEAARRRIIELEAEAQGLLRSVEELNSKLQVIISQYSLLELYTLLCVIFLFQYHNLPFCQQIEESDQAEINQLKKKVAELTRQLIGGTNGLKSDDRKAKEGENTKKFLSQGDVIDRAVHEAALEMLRTIQREHILFLYYFILFYFILKFYIIYIYFFDYAYIRWKQRESGENLAKRSSDTAKPRASSKRPPKQSQHCVRN